jgi:DNA-binding MarR family transcriptional regulator/N-acetylglutamate synthase-like GNAT family acetyltransferase
MSNTSTKQEINEGMINSIRFASRALVRKFGYMNKSIAGTKYSPSAVHTIIEIGAEGKLSGKELSKRLNINKSSVSRLVQNLIKRGELEEEKSDVDTRKKNLFLTTQGEATLNEINNFGQSQVSDALGPLTDDSRNMIMEGLNLYSNALNPEVKPTEVSIHEGYRPGLIGAIAGYHGTIHNKLAGLGAIFEGIVAAGMAEFMPREENSVNKTWYAEQGGKIVGGITIDGEDLGNNIAHLRWFIIDNTLQSAGLGSKLFQKTMDFCDVQGFDEVHLWTYKGLDAAKKLYERSGFELVEEIEGDKWGKKVVEQKYVLTKNK